VRRSPLLLAAALALAAVGLGARPPASGRAPSAGRPLLARPAPTVAEPARTEPARTEAVRALLARRAAAVLAHDAAAMLGTDDPGSLVLAAHDTAVVANLRAVPLASWTYDLDPDPTVSRPPPARPGVEQSWAPRVVLRYALAGYDARPASLRQDFTFALRDGQWRIAADDDPGAQTARDLWDGGPVLVRRGRHSLVLAHPADGALAAGIAAEVDRDIPDVTRVWGGDWARRAVVLVPSGASEMAAVVQTTADLSAYAAVQSAELGQTGAGDQTPVGDRIAVNPRAYAAMSPPARRVLLTHELTHVATRAATGPDAPLWLVEGLADYVGFAPTGLPVRAVAGDLAAEVAGGRVPAGLPADADFTAADRRLPAVYNEAWTACRLISARAGESALVRLYRLLGADADPDRDAALRRGLAAVLKTTPESFTAAWRASLRADLA
jgi:hypothetical protein